MKLISLNLIVHIKIYRRVSIINGSNGEITTSVCHTNANEMFHDSQFNNQFLKVPIYIKIRSKVAVFRIRIPQSTSQ